MTLTIHLGPDEEKKLAERAARSGQAMTDYVHRLIARDLQDVDGPPVPLRRQAILDRLNAEAAGLRRRYGVKTLAVFGSMARGDDRVGSDVDVLVAFEDEATFDNFMGLKLDLEELFGRRVDLLTPQSLRPEMQEEIEKEAILVP